ncbi:MAG: ATP-binding cassette domain-containing protein [Treponema sp.]|jgi:ABC-type multidrug transport system ATPase subunit|nr:ATP-binding cassette domain-containing protein [Treponema sp.]
MVNVVELKEVSFSAQDKNIIQGVSVEFTAGKTTAIIGPSGGGKSTVLKLSAGLLVPDQGEVYYKNKNVAYMNRTENLDFRREGAFVFQDSALWANQDLFQILELPLKIHFPQMNRKERAQRIKEVTMEVGYRKDLAIRPSRLSMGEQKLIAFARALLCTPELLYLDEWTESLDESAAERLIRIVRKKQKEGVSILFVSHDMRIIKDLADFVIVISDGKLVYSTTKERIANDSELSDYLGMEMTE